MKRSITAPVAILLAPLVATSSGCTLVGFGIGAGIDNRKPAQTAVTAGQLRDLKKGQPVSLFLSDGRRLDGRFSGVGYQQADTYAFPYAAARETKPGGAALPSLGAGAHITGRTFGQEQAVELLGFDLEGVVARPLDEAIRSYRFEEVATLRDASGLTVSGEQLQGLVTRGQVPLLSEIKLEGPAQKAALGNVNRIEVRAQKHGKLIGALVGLAVDILLFAGLAAASQEW